MREPWFWRSHSVTARMAAVAMAPFSFIYDFGQRARAASAKPMAAPVPIICIGNATLGGAGKTPFAIMVHALLNRALPHGQFLSRGYGGRETGPLKVDPAMHSAADVGDEPLLLARHGTVWISRNRADGINAAVNDGASYLILDDGFQNPTIEKTFSILLIDASDPQGNGRIFPAGPLREPLTRAAARADMVVSVGSQEHDAHPRGNFSAWLAPVHSPQIQRVVAFSGIGRPGKFFDMLEREGFDVARRIAFPDHHQFRAPELAALAATAGCERAVLITTEKDHVRLPGDFRETTLTFPVMMQVSDPEKLIGQLTAAIDAHSQ